MIRTAEAAGRLELIPSPALPEVLSGLFFIISRSSSCYDNKGYIDFATRWIPILDKYHELGIHFALEAHPTEIAFDIASAKRTLKAVITILPSV